MKEWSVPDSKDNKGGTKIKPTLKLDRDDPTLSEGATQSSTVENLSLDSDLVLNGRADAGLFCQHSWPTKSRKPPSDETMSPGKPQSSGWEERSV